LFKHFKRNFLASVAAMFLLALAFPMVVSAAPAFRNLSANTTSVQAGQAITFNIRTTVQATNVWATVDGQTIQAIPGAANAIERDWTLTVNPTRTTVVMFFANANNTQNGAATASIPVNVTTVAAVPPIGQVPPVTSPGTGTGPLAIHSVTETPALRAGEVQLTVVTGTGAGEVWVRFDGDRFRRGQRTAQTASNQTWVINFQPAQWATQTVQISSNTTYTLAGAINHSHQLALSAPFVRPVNPQIQNIQVSPRDVNTGANTTFTIRTNIDAEVVWVVDVDGNRHNAQRTQNAATTRTWTVTFNPRRTGQVQVFANATDTATGAATRNENITVRQQRAEFTAGTAHWSTGNNVTVEVTTNQWAERVWVEHLGQRLELNRQNWGSTGNRTWRVEINNVSSATSNLQVRASERTDALNTNLNNLSADASRTVSITGWGGDSGSQNVSLVQGNGWLWSVQAQHLHNDEVRFTLNTTTNVTGVFIQGRNAHPHGAGTFTIDLPRSWVVGSGQLTFEAWGTVGHQQNNWATVSMIGWW